MSTEEQQIKQFKCKIAADQGKTGIFSFNAYIHFDESNDDAISENAVQLAKLLKVTEEIFRGMGYKVASDVKDKVKEEK